MWVLGLSSNGNSNIAYSADGITWKYASNSVNTILTQIDAIASNGSMWIAVGLRSSDSTAHAVYSYDGYNWYESTSAASIFGGSSGLSAVAWNGTMWVIGGYGAGASLAYSYDGINWKKVTSVVPYVQGIAYNSSMWIVVGNNNTGPGGDCVGYSYDGISWTLSASGSSVMGSANDVEWNGIMWVAVGSRVTGSPYPGVGAAYSYDGINWTAASGVVATAVGQVLNITWNGSRWFASCYIYLTYYKTMITSVDGINWTLESSASSLVSNVIYDVSSRRFITYDPPSRRQLGGTGTTSAGGTSNVNFGSTLFSTTPIITATITGVNPAAVLLSSMGPTGFTATTYNPSFSITGPVPFNWNAIQL
jgi:hypothetical protein